MEASAELTWNGSISSNSLISIVSINNIHLEYCIQAWNPWLIKDKEILEKVQKRAISMTSGLSEKLREVGLTSLEESRKREDMIQVWKILHGHDHVDKNKWISSAYVPGENERQTRMSSDPLNLKLPVVHTEIRRNFLSSVSDPYHFDADPDPHP